MRLTGKTDLGPLTDKLIKQDCSAHTSGFSSGRAGLLVLYCELYSINRDQHLLKIIDKNISVILEEIGSPSSLINYYPADFSIGLCGIASLIKYLGDKDFVDPGNLSIVLDQFNSTIYEVCLKNSSQKDFSYFHGITGVLKHLYTFGENETERRESLVSNLLNQMGNRRLSDFFSNYPKGINYGVPYGLAGCLTVLYEISKSNRNNPDLCNILNDEIDRLKVHFSASGFLSEKLEEKTVFSWSNGLPMILKLLMEFDAERYDPEIENLVLEIYNSRYFEECIMLKPCDLSIATGLGGLMLTISATNQIKNIPELVSIEKKINGIFLENFNVDKLDFSRDRSSFFNGSTGIALGYCSLLTGAGSDWKRYLLLN